MAKSKSKSDDKEQSKRFIEKARELGLERSGKEFEKKFKTIIKARHRKKT